MKLASVRAVVTGGASGLGRATAARFAAAGDRVAILDRPASAGAERAREQPRIRGSVAIGAVLARSD